MFKDALETYFIPFSSFNLFVLYEDKDSIIKTNVKINICFLYKLKKKKNYNLCLKQT